MSELLKQHALQAELTRRRRLGQKNIDVSKIERQIQAQEALKDRDQRQQQEKQQQQQPVQTQALRTSSPSLSPSLSPSPSGHRTAYKFGCVGNGSLQQWPHGLLAKPTRVEVYTLDSDMSVTFGSTDATNICVTSNVGKRYWWRAEV